MKTKYLVACLLLMIAAHASGFQSSDQWVRHTSTRGRFSVLLPQEPKLNTSEGTGQGGEGTFYDAVSEDSESVYEVSYKDIPSGRSLLLEKTRDGLIGSFNGRVLSDDAISLGGHPGREFKISSKKENRDLVLITRLYSVKHRMYLLRHIFFKSSDTPRMAEKTARFFDSFRVTEGK